MRVICIFALASAFWIAIAPVAAQNLGDSLETALNSTRWEGMREIVPRTYVAGRAVSDIAVDGRLDEIAWSRAPWSEAFVDIEGPVRPDPPLRTRLKMLWDDSHLYVAAELTEPHVWATLTELNSIIYRDNDFEVFVDPDGDNHNYYEFEVNALNTIWELQLVRPYRDGGPAILGRNMDDLKTAVQVNGSVNDPTDEDDGWTVELAFPWEGFRPYSSSPLPPRPGDLWRMNFSRVQWDVDVVEGSYQKRPDTAEHNWVWSPQGAIDMHMPERWGFVLFEIDGSSKTPSMPFDYLTHADLLMEIYHRQHAYHSVTGEFARNVTDLGIETDPGIGRVRISARDSTFEAEALVYLGNDRTITLFVDEEGRLSRRNR